MDLIVVVPGILGSELVRDGKLVWGFSPRAVGTALVRHGEEINAALMLEPSLQGDAELEDGVTPAGLLPDLQLIPGLWKVDGYTKLRHFLAKTLLRDGFGYVEFAYDWRRDNRYLAAKLKTFVEEAVSRWRKTAGADARAVLVTHSMAGNIARHYLEVMKGWEDALVRSVVSIGTPYRGSVNALSGLLNGTVRGPVDLSAMTRSFSSVYQLLPVYPVLDTGDGSYRRLVACTGLPHLDTKRVADGLQFHEDIATAAALNRSHPRWPKDGYDLKLVVGRAQRTAQAASLLSDGSAVTTWSYRGQRPGGDGTVSRGASIPLENASARDLSMYYSTTCHASLQSSTSVLQHIKMAIEDSVFDFKTYRRPTYGQGSATGASLSVPDLVFSNERADLLIEPESNTSLLLEVFEFDQSQPCVRQVCAGLVPGVPRSVSLPELKPGSHKVTLRAKDALPVTDYFVVAEA